MSKTKTYDQSQSKKFADKARELSCDENETGFEERLRRIAKQKPKKTEKTPEK